MTRPNNDALFAEIRKEIEADRNADYSVTAEEGKKLLARYPKDTPAEFEKIGPERFFDGD